MSGTISGVTAGTDLTGGGTTGSVTLNLDTTKVPRLASANSFSAAQSITSNAASADALTVTNNGSGAGIFITTANGAGVFASASGNGVTGSSSTGSGLVGVNGGSTGNTAGVSDQ